MTSHLFDCPQRIRLANDCVFTNFFFLFWKRKKRANCLETCCHHDVTCRCGANHTNRTFNNRVISFGHCAIRHGIARRWIWRLWRRRPLTVNYEIHNYVLEQNNLNEKWKTRFFVSATLPRSPRLLDAIRNAWGLIEHESNTNERIDERLDTRRIQSTSFHAQWLNCFLFFADAAAAAMFTFDKRIRNAFAKKQNIAFYLRIASKTSFSVDESGAVSRWSDMIFHNKCSFFAFFPSKNACVTFSGFFIPLVACRSPCSSGSAKANRTSIRSLLCRRSRWAQQQVERWC